MAISQKPAITRENARKIDKYEIVWSDVNTIFSEAVMAGVMWPYFPAFPRPTVTNNGVRRCIRV